MSAESDEWSRPEERILFLVNAAVGGAFLEATRTFSKATGIKGCFCTQCTLGDPGERELTSPAVWEAFDKVREELRHFCGFWIGPAEAAIALEITAANWSVE